MSKSSLFFLAESFWVFFVSRLIFTMQDTFSRVPFFLPVLFNSVRLNAPHRTAPSYVGPFENSTAPHRRIYDIEKRNRNVGFPISWNRKRHSVCRTRNRIAPHRTERLIRVLKLSPNPTVGMPSKPTRAVCMNVRCRKPSDRFLDGIFSLNRRQTVVVPSSRADSEITAYSRLRLLRYTTCETKKCL